MEKKKTPISLKNLPLPLDPHNSQVKKLIQTSVRYVPEAGIGKQRFEEGTKAVKFDHEANTVADLLADVKIVQKKNRDEENDEASVCSIKHIIDSYNTQNQRNLNNCENQTCSDYKPFHNHSGEPNRVSAKSQLHEICAANNWKSPLFECCKEEGHCHLRLFTYKVIVEIEGATTGIVLECFGGSRPKKKAAAEHAAEGALWYLKHLGYFPINHWRKRKK